MKTEIVTDSGWDEDRNTKIWISQERKFLDEIKIFFIVCKELSFGEK